MSSKLKRHYQAAGIAGAVAYLKSKVLHSSMLLLECRNPSLRYAYHLRIPSSDVNVFRQIFIDKEYEFNTRSLPATILDAGANIGLSSIYFASRFPDARIIAVEPEESNFSVLEMNSRPYENITPVRAALWHRDEQVNLIDPDLGKWGFMTHGNEESGRAYGNKLHHVRGLTVRTILDMFGIEHLDILKMDIEGSEREVFSDAGSWLPDVDTLIVELHEHMKPGCNRSFREATMEFPVKWLQGENVFLTRESSCLSI